jgi:hypothetical protein
MDTCIAAMNYEKFVRAGNKVLCHNLLASIVYTHRMNNIEVFEQGRTATNYDAGQL